MIKFGREEKWLLGLAGCFIVLYALLASPIYTFLKAQDVKKAYGEVSKIEYGELDDEDEDILLGYQADKIDVIIADENLNPVYSNRNRGEVEQVDKYIVGKLDQFEEMPNPVIKDLQGMTIIRMKAVREQNGHRFYIVIRTEICGVQDMVRYTTWFMMIGFLAGAAGYYFMKKKRVKEEQDRDDEIERRARELVEAQKEFVANVSHGLKTPLAVISGQVEMLECMGEDIDRDYYYSSIYEEINKMTDMVGTLLDITILDHRMEKMEMCEVNLSELMEYMILKYDAVFKKNKIKLQTKLEENCMVNGNRMYLEEAVNNLIMNAVQFTPQGKKIRMFLERDGADAMIRIYNDGSRISEKNMEDIWNSFYIGENGTARSDIKSANAGLGLYLVRKITEQHGGLCGVQNMENGVEFWLRIPVL